MAARLGSKVYYKGALYDADVFAEAQEDSSPDRLSTKPRLIEGAGRAPFKAAIRNDGSC